ncbi:hypothetical protein COR50_11635 [Chitinophaga caeni]|uniref:Malonyl-CoA:ACP transacylase (MAT) domain-containing protein n=1 Tax=Chitinophaga caeni TaxID=2029983 RepID=A0A291QV50_9BACT|nr:acyltransferase domain-containing protein [Chitinophaga caeni]ATL47762.1 hypothetical protein COR50_11635 [Chitinophaga caeni]
MTRKINTNDSDPADSYPGNTNDDPLGNQYQHGFDDELYSHGLHVLSAASPEDLQLQAKKLLSRIQSEPGWSLRDITYTLAGLQTNQQYNWLVYAETKDALVQGLEKKLAKKQHPAPAEQMDNRLAWIFTGMGPQWYGMGRQLYRENAVFRQVMDECNHLLLEYTGYSLLGELFFQPVNKVVTGNYLAQTANFFIQVSLSRMLHSMGLPMDVVVGHSVGEIAASVIAGGISLEDGIKIVHHWGSILEQVAGHGTLLSVGLGEHEAVPYLEDLPGLEIATINAPRSMTVAGNRDQLSRLEEMLKNDGIAARFVQVDVAYHSSQLSYLEHAVKDALGFVKPLKPVHKMYSTVTAELVEHPLHDADYWWRNIRQQVYFKDVVASLLKQGYTNFIEIGPHPVLRSALQETAMAEGKEIHTFFSLKKGTSELPMLINNLERSMGVGVPVNFSTSLTGERLKISLFEGEDVCQCC